MSGLFFHWVVFLMLMLKSSLQIFVNSSLSDMSFIHVFSQVLGLSSHSFDIVFHRAEVFNFKEVQLIVVLSIIRPYVFIS